jgi:hypothetical protein
MLYLQNPPPRDDDDSVLYHYTDAAGLIGVLSSGTMWASDMRDLNDSAEITLQLKEAAQVLSTRPGDFPGWPENRHDVTSAIQMLSLPQPGYWFSASFSAEPDLLSQWRGYGGAKQSFAIGFDKGQLADAAMEVDATLYKCDYDAAIRSSRVDQAIQQGLIELERRPHSYLGFHIRDELQRTAALTKHESFSEEREYRLVVPHLPCRWRPPRFISPNTAPPKSGDRTAQDTTNSHRARAHSAGCHRSGGGAATEQRRSGASPSVRRCLGGEHLRHEHTVPALSGSKTFPRITPHNLRHSAASFAVSAGANVKAVQRMLGHASAAMTLDVYADLFDADLDSVATSIDAARSTAIA